MTTATDIDLYRGEVLHERTAAPRLRFVYRVFSLLIDIDRIDDAAGRLRLFSHDRFNLMALHDRDHGPRDGSPLRPWIDDLLGRAGIDLAGGTVRLLCYPRVLGYVFNPLSLWFCHHADGSLRAVLCEVRNTFGECHGYLLHRDGVAMEWPVRDETAKVFHVSPFMPVCGVYRFHFTRPDERYAMTVNYFTDPAASRPTLVAVQSGRRASMTDAAILRCALAMPLMTVKVIAAIHWQALKIWVRGGRYHRKPAPPTREITR